MNEAEVLADFRRRYEGTYVFVQSPDSDERHLYKMDYLEPNSSKVAVMQLSSDEVGGIRLNYGTAHTLKFVSAPVGVFQHGTDAFLCQRLPRRQYRRGICSDNTLMVPVTRRIAALYQNGMTWALVNAAFEHKTHTLKEALALLESGKHRSIALSDFLSLSLSSTEHDDHILFHWDLPIARMAKTGKISHIYEKHMAPQIAQYLGKESYGTGS